MNQAAQQEARKLIGALGGPSKVAELLGYDKGGVQRVQNWLARGIPAAVKVDRPDLFMNVPAGAQAREGQSDHPHPLRRKDDVAPGAPQATAGQS